MTPNREWSENVAKFKSWLNEGYQVPLVKRGLKTGAPEEAKAAYAKFLAEEEARREWGQRGLR